MEDIDRFKRELDDSSSPGEFLDHGIYEDAGDLEFNMQTNFQSLILARLPRDIWNAWSKLDDDAEIRLGTVRRINEIGPDGSIRQRLQMLLSTDLAQHQGIPKEYGLDITSEDVKSTFIFTEQNLPGYDPKVKNEYRPSFPKTPTKFNRDAFEKGKQPGTEKKYKKAIPKKTALVGKVKLEANCVAIGDDIERLLAEELEKAKKTSRTPHVLDKSYTLMQPGSANRNDDWSNFIKKPGGNVKKPQLQKATRMPQNELFDAIMNCFKQYNHWSMKALRNELLQPEAYLRETLDQCAVMSKAGPFHGRYHLKEEYKAAQEAKEEYNGASDGVAPDDQGRGIDSDIGGTDTSGEDSDVKFEDAI